MGNSCTSTQRSFKQIYDINKVIGAGAFAQVGICTHKGTHEERVVKIISKPFDRNDIQTEVNILSEVADGQNSIVKYYDKFEDKHFFYFVMEYCRGGELFDSLCGTRRCTEVEIANWMTQALDAISILHEHRIVHRDIKPQNFLFYDKEQTQMRLIDFGLSFKLPSGVNYLNETCGTPEFIAPELIRGQYGCKVDVWACGVILYMMLFGALPFSGLTEIDLFRNIVETNPSYAVNKKFSKSVSRYYTDDEDEDEEEDDPDVAGYVPPHGAVALCKALLSKDPRKRPTAAEARQDFWFADVMEQDPRTLTSIPSSIRMNARTATMRLRHHTMRGVSVAKTKTHIRSESIVPDSDSDDENSEGVTRKPSVLLRGQTRVNVERYKTYYADIEKMR